MAIAVHRNFTRQELQNVDPKQNKFLIKDFKSSEVIRSFPDAYNFSRSKALESHFKHWTNFHRALDSMIAKPLGLIIEQASSEISGFVIEKGNLSSMHNFILNCQQIAGIGKSESLLEGKVKNVEASFSWRGIFIGNITPENILVKLEHDSVSFVFDGLHFAIDNVSEADFVRSDQRAFHDIKRLVSEHDLDKRKNLMLELFPNRQ